MNSLAYKLEQSHLYDLPCDPATFVCSNCKEDVPIYDKVPEITDKAICSDCIGDYCKERVESSTDLVRDFITAHEVEFYLSYYLKGLTQRELLEVIKDAYTLRKRHARFNQNTEYIDMEREFCTEHDMFFDYLMEA